jgi:hypothetical protein
MEQKKLKSSAEEKLTTEERHAFNEISYQIGDGRPHPIEHTKGAAVPKDRIPEFMSSFVKKGRYIFDGKCYTITGTGKGEFQKHKNSLERAAPGRLIY